MTHALRVAVVGGSLGGLTAGLVLGDLGYDVRIFERAARPLEGRGAGIVVLADTVRYFAEHGVLDIEAITASTGWLRYLSRDGSTRYQEPRPHRYTSWTTIYRALLACFPRDRYHLGKELVGFDQADAVTARFADGTSVACDLLVCADGVGSTARQLLLPQVRRRYAGYVVWRGTVPEPELSPATFGALRDAITYQLLDHSHMALYPIPSLDGAREPGRRLMNWVWYRNIPEGPPLDDLLTDRHEQRRSLSVPPGLVQQRHVAALRALAVAELAPPLTELVLRTAEPFLQVIVDLEVPSMAFGRICLIGDAAFIIRPHVVAGTAKAARDAWALAEALEATEGDVMQALADWEAGQLALGRQVLARARANGDSSQFHGTWRPGDPRLAFGLYGPGR